MADYSVAFSHVGIMVADLDKMTDFYSRILGFTVTDTGLLHGTIPITFLSRDPKEHHQLALIKGLDAPPNESVVNQISFRVDSLESLQRLRKRMLDEGFTKQNPRCHGNAWTLYVQDPEDHRVELFVDTDWYITQPCSEPLDLDRPADVIRAETETFCKARPGCRPIEEWRADIARKMAEHAA
jgi:catechol 2,3-dioxygenase-like lactoylglutathione lyase family enzyme